MSITRRELQEIIGDIIVEEILKEGFAQGSPEGGYKSKSKGRYKGLADPNSNWQKEVTYKIVNDTLFVFTPIYNKYIQQGRRPGAKKIPIKVILKQLKTKRLRKRKGKPTDLNSIAYAIQNAIFKRGIKPRPMIKKALENAQNIITIDISEYISQGLTNLFKKT